MDFSYKTPSPIHPPGMNFPGNFPIAAWHADFNFAPTPPTRLFFPGPVGNRQYPGFKEAKDAKEAALSSYRAAYAAVVCDRAARTPKRPRSIFNTTKKKTTGVSKTKQKDKSKTDDEAARSLLKMKSSPARGTTTRSSHVAHLLQGLNNAR